MSNYTKTTDFEAKDSLPSGDNDKIIKGAEFETEFDAISTAIATKADTAGPTFTGTATFATTNATTVQIGGVAITSTAAELNTLDGITSTTAELNTLDGFTGTVDDLNYAKDLRASGVTGDEFDILDGLTATAAELNILDGATLSTAELNLLDGVTATTAELNILDGVTSTGIELNILDGVTATTAELNLLDGITATTIELNYVDGVTSSIQSQIDTKSPIASPTFTGTVTIPTADINGGAVDGVVIGGTTAAAGSFTTVSATGNITVDGTVDGRDVATDGTKLDGIEASATADQTDAEIRAAVEAATDSNVFTDADHSKLDGIEALADVTDTTNVTAAGALMDSELTNLTAVKSLDQGVATTDSPTFAGLTTTADVSFGDNDKAIFGAGSDLQIYHDGSGSYIVDNGTGNLQIDANDFRVRKPDGSEAMIHANADGAVKLFYDGGATPKLETTSTGIDVTGTVVADGAEVIGDVAINTTTPATYLHIVPTDGELNDVFEGFRVSRSTSLKAAQFSTYSHAGGSATITSTVTTGSASGSFRVLSSADGSTTKSLLNISNGNDVSFYEDTGTTAKLFWDASAESLGIGTTSPSARLHLKNSTGSAATLLRLETGWNNPSGNKSIEWTDATNTLGRISVDYTAPKAKMRFGSLYNSGYQTGDVMTLTADGNVGIGTSSPQAELHVSNGSAGFEFKPDGISDGNSYMQVYDRVAGSYDTLRYYAAEHYFHISNDEKVRIDSSGNVGIGTSSPTTALTVSTDGTEQLTINRADSSINSGNTVGTILFTGDDPSANQTGAKIQVLAGANWASNDYASHITFSNDSSGTLTERMRIDSSGNLLVGTTDAAVGVGNTNTGHSIGAAGYAAHSRSGNASLFLNRTSSDGEIARFSKDGSTVGSIASEGGDSLIIQTGTTSGSGLHFHPSNATVAPARNGSRIDNALSLGSSSLRFRDLYLSDGVYLGGTTSANKLDDYEEGTWTVDASGAGDLSGTGLAYEGKYTKIGNTVICYLRITTTGADLQVTTYQLFAGLPFSISKSGTGTVITEDIDQFSRQGFAAIGGSNFAISKCGSSTGTSAVDAMVVYMTT
jgi:hypothetical protein